MEKITSKLLTGTGPLLEGVDFFRRRDLLAK